MEKTFEQIEGLWRLQDERLQRMEHVQQESVRKLLQSKITSTHQRFLIENILGFVIGCSLEIFVLCNAELCFASWNLAIPYIINNILMIGWLVYIAVWSVRFLKHNPLTAPIVEAIRFADRWRLHVKWSSLVGFLVVVPILIVTYLPILTFICTGRAFHFSSLQNLSFGVILFLVIAFAAAIAYVIYEIRLTRELKENLKMCDELLEK